MTRDRGTGSMLMRCFIMMIIIPNLYLKAIRSYNNIVGNTGYCVNYPIQFQSYILFYHWTCLN